jgi:hypothetical protein
MELLDFSLGFAEGGGSGEALGDCLAVRFASETELRVMAGIVWLGAMTGGLAAASDHHANGTRTEIIQGLHLLKQLGSTCFQVAQGIGHEEPPF